MNNSAGNSPINRNRKPEQTEQRRKTKKIMVIVICSLVAFVVIYYAAGGIIDYAMSHTETTENYKSSYIPYPADYDEDIMLDMGYIDLDRKIYYCNSEMGVTVSLEDGAENNNEVPANYRDSVTFLCGYIEAVIAGDTDAVNGMYSDEYYAGGGEEKIEFTPQKLYNILLTSNSFTSVEENGQTLQQYIFSVEYMIRYNNCTFRNDMGSDCTRLQVFTLTERDGEIEIDAVSTYSTQN